jgi:hypothetical protein
MMRVVIGDLEWRPKFNTSTEVLFLECIKATGSHMLKCSVSIFVSHFDYLILYKCTITWNVRNNVRAFP